jgi:hypothetical protein
MTLPAVTSSMTRRQLLVRTGGVTVALAGCGLLAQAATADPAALGTARLGTYAAVLAALDADPGYELADRDAVAARFAELYHGADDGFRAYADIVLDAVESRGTPFSALPAAEARDRLGAWRSGTDPQLAVDAFTLAGFPFTRDEVDLHQIVFTV